MDVGLGDTAWRNTQKRQPPQIGLCVTISPGPSHLPFLRPRFLGLDDLAATAQWLVIQPVDNVASPARPLRRLPTKQVKVVVSSAAAQKTRPDAFIGPAIRADSAKRSANPPLAG
jgi:hypothetical protein